MPFLDKTLFLFNVFFKKTKEQSENKVQTLF